MKKKEKTNQNNSPTSFIAGPKKEVKQILHSTGHETKGKTGTETTTRKPGFPKGIPKSTGVGGR